MAGMKRKCPGCKQLLAGIETDWYLIEREIAGHIVATIGTAENARSDLKNTVESQIAANLAAYDLDYDFELNLGFRGTAWIQCPQVREKITRVCFPR